MIITHTNSVYSEAITLIDYIDKPQYVHQVSDGGMVVNRGIKIMPSELVNYVLEGKYNASDGTSAFIRSLTEKCRVGLILATGGTIWTGYSHNIKVSNKYPVHRIPLLGMTHVYAGQLANKLGTFDYVSTDSTSCISGHSAWFNAYNLLALNHLDAVVVVASDNGTSEENLDIFGGHKLTKLAHEENDPDVVKFRLGQGCNITVFESDKLARRTKHTPLAHVSDICIAAESYGNPVGISPTGEGYSKVIRRVDTSNIDFIKTHSTFSKDNMVEAEIINKKFGRIRTVNYKLRIGHTMGASTAIETALAIQEESGRFLSLGAGMGNVFSSVVIDILK